ncbi:MAG: ClC family H(+)/Cl(-) exchange transporter [Clostridia bacterium]|nr:ClC family H(+)/Cl(-) exchange transporter [Clostridia bacterium]
MKKKIKKNQDKKKMQLYRDYIELIAVGGITGVVAGAIVTIFNILIHEGELFSRGVYAYVRANPVFIPVLFLALLAGAFLVGVLGNISSVIRGCAIPQVEGATRGVIRFRWWRDLTAMFAASLLSIFMGLSIGAEGPSVMIGATSGDGVSAVLKRNQMIRRYQITGGACTGLAVASNAPLTGMAFAFEEAYKRFTPEVFICAFSTVIFGVLTRTGIYNLLNMEVQSAFHSYIFHNLPTKYLGFVVVAGIVCGVAGVVFYKSCFKLRSYFKKIEWKNPKISYIIRVMIAVLLGGAVSLLAVDVMGGGHDLIESLGTLGGTTSPSTESAFGLPLIWTLILVLVLKFSITTVNVASGIPCGIFIPIIAIGACLGGLLNGLWLEVDPNMAAYCDLMVMICMAAFFTTVVKAPITSIVMICEFTGSFASLLPVIIAVSIGYVIGEMSRTDGIYEELLEHFEEETGIHERASREVFTLTVAFGAMADKRSVRDVLWPSGARVKELARGEEIILPDGDTVLRGGDVLTIVCRTDEPKKVKEELQHILG